MRKIILSMMLLVMTSRVAFSQNDAKGTDKKEGMSYADTTEACDKSAIFLVTEDAAIYLGGHEKLVKDVNKKLSLDKSINGTIYLNCTINCKGKAYGFKVLKGIDKETDQILLNIVSELQTWKPGGQGGRAVDCGKNIPFTIKKGKVVIK